MYVHKYPVVFFFNDTATTEIYTLSLHDALPISAGAGQRLGRHEPGGGGAAAGIDRQTLRDWVHRYNAEGVAGLRDRPRPDRKSTRLNSSHANISYAVFCLKKKKDVSAALQSCVT